MSSDLKKFSKSISDILVDSVIDSSIKVDKTFIKKKFHNKYIGPIKDLFNYSQKNNLYNLLNLRNRGEYSWTNSR